ncbi:MAG TPA: diacylglycerol kinase family protein [Thermodesulfovibrionales bacterium]|nr:diacylglycerol kinase family protein [Thermodesulfovibrionales bacterium]
MKSLIVLISNPAAKGASCRKIKDARKTLESRGYEVQWLSTTRRGDAEEIARSSVAKHPSMIIAAGGDGTINEVINGIAGSRIPLAIIPMGTTNVLAKETGIPENVHGAVEAALRRTPRDISIGKISITSPSPVNRFFVLMAGIGYDGETVSRVDETLKRYSGKGAYIVSGMKTLCGFDPEMLTLRTNGETFHGYSAIIGNAARYGGNFKVTPEADISAPYLDVCIFQGKSRLDILRYVAGVAAKRHLTFRDVAYLRAEHVEIQGAAHIQIDGDYLGMAPARVEVVRDALKLIY